MFSMCSELAPRAHVPDNRIPQLMQPCHKYFSMLDILCSYPPFNLLHTLGLLHKRLGQLGFDKYPICRWSFHSTGGGVLLAPLCGFWWPSHNRGRDIVFVFLFAPLRLYLSRFVFFLFAVVNIVWLLATFTHNRGRDIVLLYTWTALHSTNPLLAK